MYKGIIKGTLYWSWLRTKHNLSEKYQVTVGQLDKDLAKTLKEAGGMVKKDDTMGYCITVKTTNFPKVYDAQLNELSDDIVSTIGNGTVAEVDIGLVPGKFANAAHYLNSIKILKLEQRSGTGNRFEKTEGFVVDQVQTDNTCVDDAEWDKPVSA